MSSYFLNSTINDGGVSQMKKVEFVRVKSELCGYSFGKGTKYSFTGIEEIIEERLKNDWSFAGYIPIETRGTGDIETISLIFQKDE